MRDETVAPSTRPVSVRSEDPTCLPLMRYVRTTWILSNLFRDAGTDCLPTHRERICSTTMQPARLLVHKAPRRIGYLTLRHPGRTRLFPRGCSSTTTNLSLKGSHVVLVPHALGEYPIKHAATSESIADNPLSNPRIPWLPTLIAATRTGSELLPRL